MASTEETPGTPFLLSVIGGVLVILGGLAEIAVGVIFTPFLTSIIPGGRASSFLGMFTLLGVLGMVWGLMILVGAAMLHLRPQQHVMWGAFVIVFSILSWWGAFGGLLIGFVVGIIGGILGIRWKPSSQFQAVSVSTSSSVPYPPPLQQQQTSPRTCPGCGNVADPGARFCPRCGTYLS